MFVVCFVCYESWIVYSKHCVKHAVIITESISITDIFFDCSCFASVAPAPFQMLPNS